MTMTGRTNTSCRLSGRSVSLFAHLRPTMAAFVASSSRPPSLMMYSLWLLSLPLWLNGSSVTIPAVEAVAATATATATAREPTIVGSAAGMHSLDLHPTEFFVERRRRRRQRARQRRLESIKNDGPSEQDDNDQDDIYNDEAMNDLPPEWFHPKVSAVYATLPKQDGSTLADYTVQHNNDDNHNDNDNVDESDVDLWMREQDFHNYRHLSRYERQYREKHGLELLHRFDTNYTALLSWTDDERKKHTTTTTTTTILTSTSTSNSSSVSSSSSSSRFLRQGTQQSGPYDPGASVRKGGRFNSFASAPLSQGYGTHYANVWVGSPRAQRKSVIVDTGSHYTAFPCKGCDSCGEEHHTDPYFDPDLSDTFRPLTCQECQLGANCKNHQCTFSQSYTEGSSWEAYQVSHTQRETRASQFGIS